LVGWVFDCLTDSVAKATFVRRLGEAAAPGEGSAGRVLTLHRIPWRVPYNWGKSRKTSVRVARMPATLWYPVI